MCIHSFILTEETCAHCLKNIPRTVDEDIVHDAPIYEGMTKLDKEAARIGRHIRGFRFDRTSRRGARGRKRGKALAD